MSLRCDHNPELAEWLLWQLCHLYRGRRLALAGRAFVELPEDYPGAVDLEYLTLYGTGVFTCQADGFYMPTPWKPWKLWTPPWRTWAPGCPFKQPALPAA